MPAHLVSGSFRGQPSSGLAFRSLRTAAQTPARTPSGFLRLRRFGGSPPPPVRARPCQRATLGAGAGARPGHQAQATPQADAPQAKGKIERLHDYSQKRLPSLFAAEAITTLAPANALIHELREHRNKHEKHREIASTPHAAWKLALREKRSVLRPPPACPWWPYVWSQRSKARVDPDGRIAFGGSRLRIDKPPGSIVVRCLHPNGDHSVLAAPPNKLSMPLLLLHSPAPAPVLL